MKLMPKTFYRRRLPHLQRDFKPHFVTFCTFQRGLLPETIRSILLNCCTHDDEKNTIYTQLW